ncbi:Tyrosine-protein phosphatase Lar-like [Dirofilaria immitis]|nr:Tyrosine-protein phosphatase Lar-like [Dirofilaria immitis]
MLCKYNKNDHFVSDKNAKLDDCESLRKTSSKKKEEKDVKTIPPQPNVAKCRANARIEVERWVRRALDKGVGGLREEFLSLKRYIPEGMTTNAFQGTFEAGKSRYKDVPCQDKYRVILRWPGIAEDYIHANYVATPIHKNVSFGPMPNSVIDFWHMVVQEESDCIVMLTNTIEKGLNKCEQYWPNDAGQTASFGDITISNTAVRALAPDETTIRVCLLKVQWKENGREKLVKYVIISSFIKHSWDKKPIVVHCSAGIGRTGAIVAIEYILEKLQQGIPCESMDQILKELRNQRPYTIQNDMQYLYVHRVMLFYFIDKYKVFADNDDVMAKYKQFVADYDKIIQYCKRMKPEETLVEVRSDSDVQIDRLTLVY